MPGALRPVCRGGDTPQNVYKEAGMGQAQISSIPIVMIIVCVVLGLNVLSGAIRGFVRKLSGLVAFLLAGILVTALLPPVTSWLHTTPVYSFIREQCETIGGRLVKNTLSGSLSASGGSGSVTGGDASSVIDAVKADDGSGRLDRGKIKAQLQAMGYDSSIIDSMSDEELESYAQQITGSFAGMVAPAFILGIGPAQAFGTAIPDVFGLLMDSPASVLDRTASLLTDAAATVPSPEPSINGGELLSRVTAGMDRVDQTKFIESLPLPQSIKDQMEAFNNENGYLKLGAKDFGSYVINYIASLIMNILAYAVTLLAVWLIIRIVLGALSVFSRLPIIGAADHLLGLVLGLIQGVLIIWLLFLVLSLFSTSEIGAGLMREVNASPFLSFLYNSNPFLNSAAGAIRGIM